MILFLDYFTFVCGKPHVLLYFQGFPSAVMSTQVTNPQSETQLRVAFDLDAVLFADESEQIYKQHGLFAFLDHEKKNRDKPLHDVSKRVNNNRGRRGLDLINNNRGRRELDLIDNSKGWRELEYLINKNRGKRGLDLINENRGRRGLDLINKNRGRRGLDLINKNRGKRGLDLINNNKGRRGLDLINKTEGGGGWI